MQAAAKQPHARYICESAQAIGKTAERSASRATVRDNNYQSDKAKGSCGIIINIMIIIITACLPWTPSASNLQKHKHACSKTDEQSVHSVHT
jgi:hypothetical protein